LYVPAKCVQIFAGKTFLLLKRDRLFVPTEAYPFVKPKKYEFAVLLATKNCVVGLEGFVAFTQHSMVKLPVMSSVEL
jgi:hypothetical protein